MEGLPNNPSLEIYDERKQNLITRQVSSGNQS